MQVLLGLYLGVLTGVVPALVSFALGFAFRYVTGLTIPGLGVVVLGAAIAGVNGGLMAFADPTVVHATNSVAAVTGLLVVLMLCFYAHAQGDRLGGTLPKHFSLARIRDRTLSKDVVDLVGGIGQVRVTVAGAVADMEGYPPLSPDLRASIGAVEWTFPADVPLDELERRVEERLRSEFDVAEADVRLDERARANVTVAPPQSGVSKRVGRGERAVSVNAVVPTGVARGDEVTLHTDAGACRGTVVAASTAPPANADASTAGASNADASTAGEEVAARPAAPITSGGEGRITIAAARLDAEAVLGATEGSVVVAARGTRREFELLSLLRRTGNRVRRLTVRAGGPLDDTTIGAADVRGTYGVAVVAHRHGGEWTVGPRGDAALAGGDDLFAVGTRERLHAFAEAVA